MLSAVTSILQILVRTGSNIDENKKGEFSETELKEIRKLIIENKDVILAQLDLFYAEKPVKAIRK